MNIEEQSHARLDGKLAIVTGSASGIGKQIAVRFAAGRKVAVADLDLGQAQEVVSKITFGGDIATAVAMDVADEAQVKAGVNEVAARFRRRQHPGQQRRDSAHRPARRPFARRLAEDPGRAPRRHFSRPRPVCDT